MYKENIRGIYEHLSPGYRRVADFLLNQYREAAFMTAAEVGRAARVDTTLVVRFAQRLGYPGYPELIEEIQEDVKRDLRTIYEPGPEDTSTIGVLRRCLTQDRNNLEYVLLHLDSPTMEKVIEILEKASRIFVVGEGSTTFLAEAFALRLTMLGRAAVVVPADMLGQAAITASLGSQDAVVGIGMTTLSASAPVMLRIARSHGAHTIAIAGSLTNPVAAAAQYVIEAPVLTNGLLASWSVIAALLHGITQTLTLRMNNSGADWVTRTDQLLGEYLKEMSKSIPDMQDVLRSYSLSPDPKVEGISTLR